MKKIIDLIFLKNIFTIFTFFFFRHIRIVIIHRIFKTSLIKIPLNDNRTIHRYECHVLLQFSIFLEIDFAIFFFNFLPSLPAFFIDLPSMECFQQRPPLSFSFYSGKSLEISNNSRSTINITGEEIHSIAAASAMYAHPPKTRYRLPLSLISASGTSSSSKRRSRFLEKPRRVKNERPSVWLCSKKIENIRTFLLCQIFFFFHFGFHVGLKYTFHAKGKV